MIDSFGIGIDIINVERFRQIPFHTKKSFYSKIFSKNEIDYCLKFDDPYPHFAGKFAVKEAVIKSINLKIHFSNIISDFNGKKPIVRINGNNDYAFKVSISHESEFAIAFVISENLLNEISG